MSDWCAEADQKTLLKMARALRGIIARGNKRGIPTTGLENARREFEFSAQRFSPNGSEK